MTLTEHTEIQCQFLFIQINKAAYGFYTPIADVSVYHQNVYMTNWKFIPKYWDFHHWRWRSTQKSNIDFFFMQINMGTYGFYISTSDLISCFWYQFITIFYTYHWQGVDRFLCLFPSGRNMNTSEYACRHSNLKIKAIPLIFWKSRKIHQQLVE